jgi:hypothetical protein
MRPGEFKPDEIKPDKFRPDGVRPDEMRPDGDKAARRTVYKRFPGAGAEIYP